MRTEKGTIVRQIAQDGALIGPHLRIERFFIDHGHKYETSVSVRVLNGEHKNAHWLLLRHKIAPCKITALTIEQKDVWNIRVGEKKQISHILNMSWIKAYHCFKDGNMDILHLYNKEDHIYVVPEEMGLRISRALGERVVLKIRDVLI